MGDLNRDRVGVTGRRVVAQDVVLLRRLADYHVPGELPRVYRKLRGRIKRRLFRVKYEQMTYTRTMVTWTVFGQRAALKFVFTYGKFLQVWDDTALRAQLQESLEQMHRGEGRVLRP